MSLLVIGGTGTLGRQVVKKALDEGFQVRCFVRNFRRSAFLREWGAELVYGDLKLPETIPMTLCGITAVIDCSTARTNDLYNAKQIDLVGKYILIEAAKQAKIRHYIFFSFLNSDKYSAIPLVSLKLLIESKLGSSNLSYTVFRLSGFFQGLISQYAVPILDQKPIWITAEKASIPYINTQDAAKICIKSLSFKKAKRRVFPLVGNKEWTSEEIIKLCEKISGLQAKITRIPVYFLKFLRQLTKLFQWSWNISDRLAFIEILSKNQNTSTSMNSTKKIFHLRVDDIEILDKYLQEYFQKVMYKLKQLSSQESRNIDKKIF
uniref:NmrA-like domain-containing protein n=1 Tax=Caloglossa intermedia TaxID=100879 RepID=A0A1Z1M5Y9_9FLOR|nr:hypothetical protein [Caloglossa intermedia]ARW61439.1 hypothetical protein [Caloglossa intermedia]